MVSWLIGIASALHIVKEKDEYLARADHAVRRFKNSIRLLRNSRKALITSFLLNLLERLVYLSIGVLIFYGAKYHIPELAGIRISVLDVYALEAYCWFGAYCVPLPGAVGASEAIFDNIFSMIISNTVLLNATMVTTRGINFYLSVLFAGIVTMVHHVHVHFLQRSAAAIQKE